MTKSSKSRPRGGRWTSTAPGPSWIRSCSDIVAGYLQIHVDILRQIASQRPVTHNLLGAGFTHLDSFQLGKPLDLWPLCVPPRRRRHAPAAADAIGDGHRLLGPIQWRCGDWDLAALKAECGARLCFHGSADNQVTLPWGRPEDVRAEVRRLIDALAADGTGAILAPCHNLQAVTPVETIVALYEEAQEYGAFSSARPDRLPKTCQV